MSLTIFIENIEEKIRENRTSISGKAEEGERCGEKSDGRSAETI